MVCIKSGSLSTAAARYFRASVLASGRGQALLILGSDGLFEFLAPVEAAEGCRGRTPCGWAWEVLATLRSSRKEELASALVQEAQSRWERNEALGHRLLSCHIRRPDVTVLQAGLYCDDVSCLLVGPDCLSDFLDNPRVRQFDTQSLPCHARHGLSMRSIVDTILGLILGLRYSANRSEQLTAQDLC